MGEKVRQAHETRSSQAHPSASHLATFRTCRVRKERIFLAAADELARRAHRVCGVPAARSSPHTGFASWASCMRRAQVRPRLKLVAKGLGSGLCGPLLEKQRVFICVAREILLNA